jgi:Holliday junction resolvase RusA-like endonuclease
MKTPLIKCRPVTFGGATKSGSRYHQFKEAIKSKGPKIRYNGPVRISIELFILRSRIGPKRNDLDNFPKPIIDALAENERIKEEKIVSLTISRTLVDETEPEGIKIIIKPQ